MFANHQRQTFLVAATLFCLSGIPLMGQEQKTVITNSVESPKTESKAIQDVSLPKQDKGLLDAAWFGRAPIQFAKHEISDYFWKDKVFLVIGKSLKVISDPITWLRENPDDKDKDAAAKIQDVLPGILSRSLSKASDNKIKIVNDGEQYQLIIRIVDCNKKGEVSKRVGPFWWAIRDSITWDFKFVDASTNRVLLAGHNRLTSGAYSTLDSKLSTWAEQFSQFISECTSQ